MRVPGEGGVGEREVRVTGYADDLAAFLADEKQLVRFKELLAVYEKGSGAQNEWEKTHAIRFGSLRDSTAVPRGWKHPEIFKASTVRYLGVFLGTHKCSGGGGVGGEGDGEGTAAVQVVARAGWSKDRVWQEHRREKQRDGSGMVPCSTPVSAESQ